MKTFSFFHFSVQTEMVYPLTNSICRVGNSISSPITDGQKDPLRRDPFFYLVYGTPRKIVVLIPFRHKI